MTFGRVHSGIIPGPRTEAPPSPQRGTRQHGTAPRPDRPWEERALCRGQTKDSNSIWINPQNHSDDDVTVALQQCAVCPVRAECAKRAPRPRVGIVAGEVWVNLNGVPVRRMRRCRRCVGWFYSSTNSSYCSEVCRGAPPGTKCRKGHEFSDLNSYIDPRGYRHCRTCKADADAKRWAVRKASKKARTTRTTNTGSANLSGETSGPGAASTARDPARNPLEVPDVSNVRELRSACEPGR